VIRIGWGICGRGREFGLTIVILGLFFLEEEKEGLRRKRWWLDLEERDGSEIR